MGILDVFRAQPVSSMTLDEPTTVTVAELERAYNVVMVDDASGSILATKKLADPPSNPTSEISGSGATAYRRTMNTDYNPQLSGNAAIETYQEMKNDSVVRSSLRVAKTPILSARWFIEPASQDPEDVYRAKFVWDNLTKWMTTSWVQFQIEALYMLDYGVYVFEKVFEPRIVPDANGSPQPRMVWRKFAPRHPSEIAQFIYDDEGGPSEIEIITDDGTVPLPIAKALIFTYDKEAGDLWGKSVLRSAYKHWFYKEQLYKIDAIQKERHGIGIPIIVLPQGYDRDGKGEANKREAQRIGMMLRTNEEAHVVVPPGWEVQFLKLEGQRVDALESAQHHAEKLYENVLANFVTAGTNQDTATLEAVFTRSSRFTAEIMRDVLNSYAIPQLMEMNWLPEELVNGYPQLKVRRLGDERDWRILSFAIRNLVGSGVIRPDDNTEAWAREEMDMPVADPATARLIVAEAGDEEGDPDIDPTPSGDERGNTGGSPRDPNLQPRQSPASGMRQAQGSGSSQGDSSGTSGTT
jgi:hypothetical protein